jgi:hypothetical protein
MTKEMKHLRIVVKNQAPRKARMSNGKLKVPNEGLQPLGIWILTFAIYRVFHLAIDANVGHGNTFLR